MSKIRPSWDQMFMSVVDSAASRSACIYDAYHIGAVFVDKKHRIVSIGYSGPSRGDINCNEEGYCLKIDGDPETGVIKRCNGAHAEMNAILNSGDTMRLDGSTLYSSVFPCYDCMKHLNNLGVERIVYQREYQRMVDGGKKGEKEIEPEALDLAHKRGIIIEKYKNKEEKK